MKDKTLKKFFDANKQHLDGNEFCEKLISKLDYYPRPSMPKKKIGSELIILVFGIVGIVLFVISGGASILLDNALPVMNNPLSYHSVFSWCSLTILLFFLTGGIILVTKEL